MTHCQIAPAALGRTYLVTLTFASWNHIAAGFDSSIASVRPRDRDLTPELRSLKLKARMRSPSRKLARVAGIRCGTASCWTLPKPPDSRVPHDLTGLAACDT